MFVGQRMSVGHHGKMSDQQLEAREMQWVDSKEATETLGLQARTQE
jgi:hypothetical protein